MMRTLTLLLIASTALAAPVPKSVLRPDPLGKGYMGVYASREGATGDTTLVIDRVVPNSAAAAAGLRAGDKFVQVGELRPHTFDEVRELIGTLRPGTRVSLIILRNGREQESAITLGTRPPDFENGVLEDPQP